MQYIIRPLPFVSIEVIIYKHSYLSRNHSTDIELL